MKKEIMLDRKLVCRILTGEDVLDELLSVMFSEDTAKTVKGWVESHKPIRIEGGEEKGNCLLCKAIRNAGGIVFMTEDGENYINSIPVIVLTKNVRIAPRKSEAIKKTVQKALELLGENRAISAFYRISEGRWAVEVDDKYFGIYDTQRKTFVD